MRRLGSALLLLQVLSACTGDGSSGSASGEPAADANVAVIGTMWQWLSTVTPVERTEVLEPPRYTLRLNADNRAEIRFDCNRGAGDFAMDGNRLSFGPLLSTRMACPPDTQDAVFMDQLSRVSTWFVRDGELYLELPFDSGTMRFSPARDQD